MVKAKLRVEFEDGEGIIEGGEVEIEGGEGRIEGGKGFQGW